MTVVEHLLLVIGLATCISFAIAGIVYIGHFISWVYQLRNDVERLRLHTFDHEGDINSLKSKLRQKQLTKEKK
jgi:hypothetical protein